MRSSNFINLFIMHGQTFLFWDFEVDRSIFGATFYVMLI